MLTRTRLHAIGFIQNLGGTQELLEFSVGTGELLKRELNVVMEIIKGLIKLMLDFQVQTKA